MTAARIAYAVAAIAAALVAFQIATAPALWWMTDADRALLIAQAEAQHGAEAADYLKKISRH